MPKTITALRQKNVIKHSESSCSEEEQSSITTEISSEEELDPWTTLINDTASKVRDQYDDILRALLMEGHDESETKEEAFAQILKGIGRCLHEQPGMDESVEKGR